MINNNTILITGGTGSFGKRMLYSLLTLYKPKKVIIFSRDELKQSELEKKLTNKMLSKVRFFIGDVRDLERLNLAFQGVDIVIHAAALKQVPSTEYNPTEAIKTNIIGAQNIISASLLNNVKKTIAISTDKASSPINLYGATKLVSDKLFVSANNIVGKNKISFAVVRYGNVMFSRGSVIPIFLKQYSNNNTFTITDESMTRFNITLDEGVFFVLNSLQKMKGSEIFIPKLSSYRVIDLIKAISKNPKIKLIGLRPGEKIHEELISHADSIYTKEYKNYYTIFPSTSKKQINKKSFSYNSKDNINFLKVSELKIIINNELGKFKFENY